MTPEDSAGFADACARVCPGFVAVGPARRGRKSALLWSQLAPAARLPLEDAVRGHSRRWRAFLVLTVFALARELEYLRSFTAHPPSKLLARLHAELAEAVARFAETTRS